MSSSNNISQVKKEEYENFYQTTQPKINYDEEISILKKELRQKIKERTKTQEESLLIKNKLTALKFEEKKAIKRIETTKSNIITIEAIRKDLLSEKISTEEHKLKKQKQLEIQREKVHEKKLETQKKLKEILINVAQKKHKEKAALIQDKKLIRKQKNIQMQDEEEKNKQICIKVKSSKAKYIDAKQKLIQDKKAKIKQEILEKLNQEIKNQKKIEQAKEKLKQEEQNLKGNLKTIETTYLDESNFY